MHLSHLALALLIVAGDASAQSRSSSPGDRKQASASYERQSQVLDDPGFRIEQLELDVFDLALASSASLREGQHRLPRADSPMGAVLRLVHAYALGRVTEYGLMLTEDFRLEFGDPALTAKYPDGFRREDEMASLDHLVHGFVDDAGVARPRARAMKLRVDRIVSLEDPAFPADRAAHAVVGLRARLEITLETGERFGAIEGYQRFHLVRGDRARAADGAARDADHWYVYRWQEFPIQPERLADATPVARADGARREGAAADSSGGRDSTRSGLLEEEWAQFSLSVASPIQRGVVEARVMLAVAEPANLDLFDVSGRRVAGRELAGRAPGGFDVVVASRGTLAAGVYWLRLVQGRRSAIARVHLLQ